MIQLISNWPPGIVVALFAIFSVATTAVSIVSISVLSYHSRRIRESVLRAELMHAMLEQRYSTDDIDRLTFVFSQAATDPLADTVVSIKRKKR